MKRFYQTEWQDIQFTEFAIPSSKKLAGPEFYQAFYNALFNRYQSWDQFSLNWRKVKEDCAQFILSKSKNGNILSIGCGLGYMEQYLLDHAQESAVFIHEVAPSAWQWVGAKFAEDKKILGLIPDCMPKDLEFNLIYLSAVDYALNDEHLIGLLLSIRPFLNKKDVKGRVMMISASFQDIPATMVGKGVSFLRNVKAFAVAVLDHLGLYERGQFWGWLRTREEYRVLMQRAGYTNIEDGFIGSEKSSQYWISGC